MTNKTLVLVPAGTSEKKIAERIKGIAPEEILVFHVRQGMSPNKGGLLGGGAITVELNPQYKIRTRHHKYLCMTFDCEGETPVGNPEITFSVDEEDDLADRLYWRQVSRG